MFVNRKTEIERLKLVLKSSKACLVVIYGRRRCGKSTLIRRLMSRDSVYFSADMRERPLQIKAFAERMEVMIPGFAAPVYPDWNSVFRALNAALARKITVCIDEFPYLVRNSSDLPSVLQNLHDDNAHGRYHLILCGSSQKMMNDMVLNRKAPLYGRADEIMRIQPMSVSHLKSFLRITAIDAVEEYSVWGGIPRYWEIRKPFGSLAETISWHVANPTGLLYDEPERLFSDEIRTSVQAYTMLSLIGSGCNRLSEIAARMEKPATHLSGTLAFLTELKYI
ncbi:MAG: AAA family ATPase, partial [Bacteroidales bacterium]|nr:AAA family ATPase [Bacteroidales bacterium]